jgi:hypothetical protein
MQDNLEIERIGLPELDRERMSSVMRRSGARWYSLTVSVKNSSDETTLHAISETVGIPLPPRYVAIRPGEVAVLTYQHSSPITLVEQLAAERRR